MKTYIRLCLILRRLLSGVSAIAQSQSRVKLLSDNSIHTERLADGFFVLLATRFRMIQKVNNTLFLLNSSEYMDSAKERHAVVDVCELTKI